MLFYLNIYMYAFIQSDLQVIHVLSVCVLWELNPQPFALLTQCSTTEPRVPSLTLLVHYLCHIVMFNDILLCQLGFIIHQYQYMTNILFYTCLYFSCVAF